MTFLFKMNRYRDEATFVEQAKFVELLVDIRALQQIWMIFTSFQMHVDGETPFILKRKGIGVLF